MATKNDRAQEASLSTNTGTDTYTATPARKELVLPPLGAACNVKVAKDVKLVNNETGQFFEPEVSTPVTASVTLHRRLVDGDLTLVD